MMRNLIWIIMAVVLMVVVDLPSLFMTVVAFFVVICLLKWLNNRSLYPQSIRIYTTMFMLNVAYIILCFMYMKYHNYNYLLAFDTNDVFLPRTEDFLSSATSLKGVLENVWQNYGVFDRFQVGYYTILVFWGYVAQSIGANLYFSLQLGGTLLTSLVSVLIYKILILNGMHEHKASRYSMLISVLSILFYYNTLILRDGIIALFFVYIIYLCHKEFSIGSLLKMLLTCILMITFRVETGLVSFLFLIIYFVYTNKKFSFTNAVIMFCSLVVMSIISFFVLQNQNLISEVYSNNYEYYIEDVDKGSGMIGALQRLPFPIGGLLSIIYIALMPIPFWVKLTSAYDPLRPECYNIMNLPISMAAFFNTFVIIVLIMSLFSRNRPKLSKTIKYLLIPATIILFLQSAVVAQRRVMGLYVVFYIIWAIYMDASQVKKKYFFMMGTLGFVFIQSVGLLFF